MKVAVVIVSYNSLKFLPRTLKSVVDYAPEATTYVIDNASADGSVQFIKNNFPQFKLIIEDTNTGFAAANNIGMNQALTSGAEAILLLNPDAELTAGCLDRLLNFLVKNSKLGLVQPRVNLPSGKINSLGNCYNYLGFGYAGGNGLTYEVALRQLAWFKNSTDIPYFSGAAVLIRAEALKQVGLFDADLFLYHEDLELSLRLRCLGFGMQVVPEAEVIHHYKFAAGASKF